MSVLISALVAAAIVSTLIAVRIAVFRSAVRARLKSNADDGPCRSESCFRGCGVDEVGRDAGAVSANNESTRSVTDAS